MPLLRQIKNTIKAQNTPLTRALYRVLKSIRSPDIPPIWILHKPLHLLINASYKSVLFALRAVYWKPTFIMSLENRPKRMCFEGVGLPFRAGPLAITIGDDCRIAARIALIGRAATTPTPRLTIGNNVGIGWQSGIYVGTDITIGNNVRIAEQCRLSGYAGHPLDARDRAAGKPDLDSQARAITLEDDVWLGRGVSVNAGVTIGARTVVAAGSVVTKDLPADVLAAGVPAKVIRTIKHKDQSDQTEPSQPAQLNIAS